MASYHRMPLSKLWLFVLSLLCGLPVLLLLALYPELRRREGEEQMQRLLRAHPVASQLLASQAQKLVAAATQMSSDAVLQTTLYEMGRGQSELPLLHTTAQGQLRQLNLDFGADLLLITDARGRVLCRVGHDEAVYRDPMDGFPLVEAALRGYRLDDLWLLDGVLYRVAGAPVVAPGHDRYVGALLVGQVLGGELLKLLGRMTGVEAAFLADGRVVASSMRGEQPTAELLLATRDTAAQVVARASSPTPPAPAVVRGPSPGPERLLTFVDMPGAAAQQGAVLVLSTAGGAGFTLPELLRDALRHRRPTTELLALFGVVILLYTIGLGILRAENPRFVDRRPPAAASPYARTPAPTALPLTDAASMAVVSSVASVHAVETVVASPLLFTPSTEPAPPPPPPPSPPSPSRPPPSRPTPPQVASMPPQMAPQRPVPPPPPAQMPPPPMAQSAPQPAPPMAPPSTPPPASQPPAHTSPPWEELPPPNSNFEPTLVAGPSQPVQKGADLDSSFYQVFQQYVLARERCHESVEGISYEQFRQRLQESRAQIMQQHGCRAVDFQVYIKEGRAALRATPLWG